MTEVIPTTSKELHQIIQIPITTQKSFPRNQAIFCIKNAKMTLREHRERQERNRRISQTPYGQKLRMQQSLSVFQLYGTAVAGRRIASGGSTISALRITRLARQKNRIFPSLRIFQKSWAARKQYLTYQRRAVRFSTNIVSVISKKSLLWSRYALKRRVANLGPGNFLHGRPML